MRRELEAEKKDSKSSTEGQEVRKPTETELEASPLLAVKGKFLAYLC